MSTPATPTNPARTKGGELRAKVARLLADRPADTLTIGDMARQLGHSHGAVRNAALTLVRRGEADQGRSGQPEFRANAKTAAAAKTAVISPPGTHAPRAQAAAARTTITAAAPTRQTGPIRRAGASSTTRGNWPICPTSRPWSDCGTPTFRCCSTAPGHRQDLAGRGSVP